MYTQEQLDEYLVEIRKHVCSRCIQRPPGGPPCAPHGKRCGIEMHFEQLIDVCRATRRNRLGPYVSRLHEHICTGCDNHNRGQCPCPLERLLLLAVDVVDAVDRRRERLSTASMVND